MNPRYTSPLRLGGQDCSPYDLDVTKCNKELDAGSLSHCCEELFDVNSFPLQTLESSENYLVLFFCSFFFLSMRMVLWRHVYDSGRGHSLAGDSDFRFWVVSWWDQYVAMLVASVLAGLLTNYTKLLVGTPRPCYYALKIYSSVNVDEREFYDSKCT